jgi:RND family efflux transporter MFP subunit
MTRKQKNKWIKILLLVFVVVLVAYFIKSHNSKSAAQGLPPPTVTIQKPKTMKISEYVMQTGNTVAYNSVNLVARVEGYLDAIKFVDGAFVKKGQNLFIIEPDSYLEQVDEAEAGLASAKASYEYNKTEYARQQQLYKQNATSLKNVEEYKSNTEESKAEVEKQEANLKIAEINYGYTHVDSPFDGRIGRHLVDMGNLVGHAEATKLAVVQQISPIYVYFNLNELDLIKMRNAARSKGLKPSDIDKIPAYVGMQNEKNYPHQGKLDFINTGLNASTGTMEVRAILENKNFALVPGLFVQVRIPITEPKDRLTIPEVVVQYDQIGPYVLIADKNNVVVLNRVELGGKEQDRVAITKGITADDNVIIDGVQFAIPGNKVNPKKQDT